MFKYKSCKQVRLIRGEKETILGLQKMNLAHSQIASFRPDNSSSSKCNCLSTVQTKVKAKSWCTTKSLYSIKDLKFSIRLSNIHETMIVSGSSNLVQDMDREGPKPRFSNKKCKMVLLPASSHGRRFHKQLHSTFEDKYDATNISQTQCCIW